MHVRFIKLDKIVITFLAILILVSAVLGVSYKIESVNGNNFFTVVIDAGHGGLDAGVTGRNTGVKESELNLIYAKILAEKFKKVNMRAILTRKDENGLYDIGDNNYKKSDFAKRKKIIEDAKPQFVISIHMNYYPSSYRRGSQVFFNGKNNNSRQLGLQIQDLLNDNLNFPILKRRYSALHGDFFIVNCTEYPSVIVECGFLSNGNDEKLLMDENHQEKICENIFQGSMNYLFSPN